MPGRPRPATVDPGVAAAANVTRRGPMDSHRLPQVRTGSGFEAGPPTIWRYLALVFVGARSDRSLGDGLRRRLPRVHPDGDAADAAFGVEVGVICGALAPDLPSVALNH